MVEANASTFATVTHLVKPLIDQLQHQRSLQSNGKRAFSESRTTALRTKHEPLFTCVTRLLTENGILDAVSQYIGRTANIIDINPQVNDSSDDFWQHTFSDVSDEKPATSYYHRDASGGDIKAIIYLSDVELDNGPFCFALGTHKNRPNFIYNFIQEVNDSSELSSTDIKSRKQFASLPAVLRKKCAFGNDLLSDSIAAHSILTKEWQITSSKGHVVVFDSKGIHRGGMVLNKERIVITCVLG